LVVRFGAMGDMVLLIPMLKMLQQRFGQPCDLISSGAWTLPLMQRVPACGSVHLLTSRRAPYLFNRSQWQFVAWLRRRPAGPVFVFESDEKSLSLLRRGGVKPEWICTLRDLPRLPHEHIAAHALRLAHQTPPALQGRADIAVDPNDKPDTRPTLSASDHLDCTDWLQQHGLRDAPLVLIQPGNKKTMKGGDRHRSSNVDYWPEANWGEVIRGIREHLPAAHVILCGVPSERPLAEDIIATVRGGHDHILIATDELPIPRLLALQARAHSLITVNTGPAHAAAAMGCPLLVMFTRHAHRGADLYAPLRTSAPVRLILPEVESADAGLDSISPAKLLTAWREISGLVPAPVPTPGEIRPGVCVGPA
jgi:heptosyltransferase-2/heptosyltransferase-3